MSARKSVLGVLGLCWVGMGNLTHLRPSVYGRCGGVFWVCWVYAPARARMGKISSFPSMANGSVFSLREASKNLTNPTHLTQLLSKHCFIWVLSVLGMCWVGAFCVGLGFGGGIGDE